MYTFIGDVTSWVLGALLIASIVHIWVNFFVAKNENKEFKIPSYLRFIYVPIFIKFWTYLSKNVFNSALDTAEDSWQSLIGFVIVYSAIGLVLITLNHILWPVISIPVAAYVGLFITLHVKNWLR
jgi:hypothetical protein